MDELLLERIKILEDYFNEKQKMIDVLKRIISCEDTIIEILTQTNEMQHNTIESLNEIIRQRKAGEDHEPRRDQETGEGSGSDVSEL